MLCCAVLCCAVLCCAYLTFLLTCIVCDTLVYASAPV
jgi:hypothetical protein